MKLLKAIYGPPNSWRRIFIECVPWWVFCVAISYLYVEVLGKRMFDGVMMMAATCLGLQVAYLRLRSLLRKRERRKAAERVNSIKSEER